MYHDEYTGRYHTHYRQYDPLHGRWLSEDPAGYMDGLNLYAAYMGVNGIDPLGLALYAFDGTGNDMRDKTKTPTHVAALFNSYTGVHKEYQAGVGTNDGAMNGLGNAFGYGAKERLGRMFELFEQIYDNGNGDTDIDIIGFSRGAGLARAFANMIHKKYPNAKIRFLGLFDTVAQFGSPDRTNINLGVSLDIPPNVEYVAHAVAKNEKRDLFPMTSIVDAYGGVEARFYISTLFGGGTIWPKKYKPSEYQEYIGQNYWERPFDGDHSSIGGGHKTGTNLRALAWMMALGQNKGVPFDIYKLKGYNRLGEFKSGINYDPPGPFKYTGDKYRKERTIYSGNLEQ